MDGLRFDTITRSLSQPNSRRRILSGLAAGILGLVSTRGAETASCRAAGSVCREHSNCCSGSCGKDARGRLRCQCQGPSDCPPARTCQQALCSGGGCVTAPLADGTACTANTGGSGTCVSGSCIDRQGTCSVGADMCAGSGGSGCNGTTNGICFCATTAEGTTACVSNDPSTICGTCVTSADCGDEAVCVRDTGTGCGCDTGVGFCEPYCS
jgi:hypothetical protein